MRCSLPISLYVLSLIYLSLLIGCGKAPINVDPALQPYVDRWNSIYKHKVDVDVGFGDTLGMSGLGEIVGECVINDDESKVVIDRRYWRISQDAAREELMFHELRHCILLLGHDSGLISSNRGQIPRSIMYPYVFGSYQFGYSSYAENINYYRNELLVSHASEP